MYTRPIVSGEPTTLGVSGKLWRDSLIMYDRATRSLWSQVNGSAVAGPSKGSRLEEIPSELTTWGRWKERHPDSLVLVKPRLSGSVYDGYHRDESKIGVRGTENRDGRLGGKELVFAIERGAAVAAVPVSVLATKRVVNGKVGKTPVVVASPPGDRATRAWSRDIGRSTLTFEVASTEPFLLRDRETKSLWRWSDGVAIEGKLAGSKLESVEGTLVYWGIWSQFHPRSAILR